MDKELGHTYIHNKSQEAIVYITTLNSWDLCVCVCVCPW